MIKQNAAKVAKQIAQENLEILKKAREQIAPGSEAMNLQTKAPGQVQSNSEHNFADLEARSKAESKRLLVTLEAELAQIRKQREIRDQQMEAQSTQNQAQDVNSGFVEPAGKKSGKIKNAFGAMKKKISDMSSRGEKQRNVSG